MKNAYESSGKSGLFTEVFFSSKTKKKLFLGGGGLGAKNYIFPTRKSNEHLCTKIITKSYSF